MFCHEEEVYMFHTQHNPDYFRFTQLKYKEDYNKNVKGKWCETPYFDIATARVAMENLSEVTAYAAQAQLKLFVFFFICLPTSTWFSFLLAEKIHTALGGHKRPYLFHANRHTCL